MIQSSKAIALTYIKHSETSVIARFLTQEWGLQSFIVKGVRKKKSRFSLASLQPFTLVELSANVQPGRDLHVLSELKITEPLASLPFNIVKTSIALFLAEVLVKSVDESDDIFQIFDFVEASVHAMEETQQPENFHLFFLLHLTRYLGFFPANKYTKVEPYFNLQHGAFEALDKGNELQLELKQSEQLARILTSTIETFEQLPFSRNERSSLLRNIIAYLQLHLEGLGKIKSLDVLETVFES